MDLPLQFLYNQISISIFQQTHRTFMPKQVIVIMQDHYPFGQCEESTNQLTKVLVRKKYSVSLQQKNRLLQKASILKKLKCQQMIKVQSILQEQETIHFLFEYIPIRLQTWISNINDQFIENFRDQLIKFSSYLANNFIKIQFQLKNIGMDHNYGAKYFLDHNFIYDPSINKQKLKSQYIRDVSNLFKPYINHQEKNNAYQRQEEPLKPHSQHREREDAVSDRNNKQQNNNQGKSKNSAISPPTFKEQQQLVKEFKDSTSNKTKEKLQKYYQQMNASMDVENQKILQQFMDVLDDQEEEQAPKHKKQPTIQNGKKIIPPQYQYGNNFGSYQDDQEVYQPAQKQKNVYNQPPQQTKKPSNQFYQQKPKNNSSKNITNQQQPQNIQVNNRSGSNYSNNTKQEYQPQPQPQPQSQNSIKPPPKMSKNSFQQAQQYQQQVIWRDGDDLQNRIKKAIQNSKSVIQKFRSIKESNIM